MRCSWLPLLLFAAVGLAESVGYWTLHNFQLFCDGEGVACVYHFSISQDNGTAPASERPCVFTVDGKDGKPANQTDFQESSCVGSTQYQVNGGWSHEGFVTVVVTNIHEDSYAFFAFSDKQLEAGKTVESQTRLAYKVGTFDISGNAAALAKRAGAEWQILNLELDYDQLAGKAQFTFDIQDTSGSMAPCTVITEASGESKVASPSFYNQKCIESDWYVSWDYVAVADSATMTLTEANKMMQAWFVWNHVSSTHSLGDSVHALALPYEDEMLR